MKTTKRKFSTGKLQQAAKLLKVVAHPVKLEILEVLETEEPLDVGTICERIGATCDLSMMSHHLSKMRDNGILRAEKRGKQVFHYIADRKILRLLDCLEGYDFD